MGSNYIVGIGELLWDIFPDGKKLGGAPSNFAYHVSQLGMNGLSVSAVGKDELGSEALFALDENKLSYHADRVDFPTGTVIVSLDGRGKPEYEIIRDVAWDNIPYTTELEFIAGQTRAVCFGTLAQRSGVTAGTISRFLDAMPGGKNTYRIFDVNLRQNYYTREMIDSSLRRCNVLKLNDEEIPVVAGMSGCGGDMSVGDMCGEIMAAYGIEIIILTCGAEGSYVFSPGNTIFRNSPRVVIADTVGAGDSFTAAFISALIRGRTLEYAHELAVEVSAYVCTRPGAMPPLPEHLKAKL